MRTAFFILILFMCVPGVAQRFLQQEVSSDSISYSANLPNTLSTHPFGVFMSRVHTNFRLQAASKPSVRFQLSSGNVWLPYVKAYIPKLEADRAAMAALDWHLREGPEIVKAPSETLEFVADGVIRFYQLAYTLPLGRQHELSCNVRAFSIDGGRMPFSLMTSDPVIEWIHSNIAGGEDPFSRKQHAYYQSQFEYTDINGRKLSIKGGEFVLSGIDLSYHYYPKTKWLHKRNVFTSVGMQTGINTTYANPSMDLGLSISLNKMVVLNKRNSLHLGVNPALMYRQVIRLGTVQHFSDNACLLSSDFLFNAIRTIDRKRYVSLGFSFRAQSPYNSQTDYAYIVLTGDRSSSHWGHAISHLYKKMHRASLFLTYSRKPFSVWLCLSEDTFVDNAPDAQTSIGISFDL